MDVSGSFDSPRKKCGLFHPVNNFPEWSRADFLSLFFPHYCRRSGCWLRLSAGSHSSKDTTKQEAAAFDLLVDLCSPAGHKLWSLLEKMLLQPGTSDQIRFFLRGDVDLHSSGEFSDCMHKPKRRRRKRKRSCGLRLNVHSLSMRLSLDLFRCRFHWL